LRRHDQDADPCADRLAVTDGTCHRHRERHAEAHSQHWLVARGDRR
jgi:hypothetical protein